VFVGLGKEHLRPFLVALLAEALIEDDAVLDGREGMPAAALLHLVERAEEVQLRARLHAHLAAQRILDRDKIEGLEEDGLALVRLLGERRDEFDGGAVSDLLVCEAHDHQLLVLVEEEDVTRGDGGGDIDQQQHDATEQCGGFDPTWYGDGLLVGRPILCASLSFIVGVGSR